MQGSRKLLIKRTLLWLALFSLICTIYVLSGQEGDASHKLSSGIVGKVGAFIKVPEFMNNLRQRFGFSYNMILRKIVHFAQFFILVILLNFSFKTLGWKYIKISALACCLLLACMDEYRQMFIAGRNASFADILIDIFGAVFGQILIMAYEGMRRADDRTNPVKPDRF